jgi:2'-5' RNA ligase
MRLFVAVSFDEKTKSRLLAMQSRIKAQSVKGSFSRPENLHLTLAFIGEVAREQVPHVIAAVARALSPSPDAFTADFGHTGCFKDHGKELWWAGPQSSDSPGIKALTAIRQRIEDGLDMAGIPYDKRPFKAHITLCREVEPLAAIEPPEDRLDVSVARISLMKSERIKAALVYTEIFAQALKKLETLRI